VAAGFPLLQSQAAAVWFDSNSIQIVPNFDWLKKDIPELKKFKIKYGFELFE
jgi:hypothetical protein